MNITPIDVAEEIIVRGSSSYDYLALSYVWGSVAMLQCTATSGHTPEVCDSLCQERDDVPQLVRDAMVFTRKIGQRYLWVDQFCIEQDNALQKHAQISRMDIICTHALATIVAMCATNAKSSLASVRTDTGLPLYAKAAGGSVFAHFEFQVNPPGLAEQLLHSQSETRHGLFKSDLYHKIV